MVLVFRDKLKKLRGKKTRKVFSEELGMSISNYSLIESGKSNPTIPTLQRIAEVTDTELVVDLIIKNEVETKKEQLELDILNEQWRRLN